MAERADTDVGNAIQNNIGKGSKRVVEEKDTVSRVSEVTGRNGCFGYEVINKESNMHESHVVRRT